MQSAAIDVTSQRREWMKWIGMLISHRTTQPMTVLIDFNAR